MYISEEQPAPLHQQNDKEAVVNRSNKISLLILESDSKTLNTYCATFKKRYYVYTAKRLPDVYHLLRAHKIAVIICDQALPHLGITGTSLVSEAKVIAPDVKGIILAGQLDFNNIKSSINKDEIFRLIRKPFDMNRLATIVNEAVEHFLENTGEVATRTETLKQNLPDPIQTPILPIVSSSIPVSANVVIIKTKNLDLYEEIKTSYQETAHFMHAENKEEIIKILEKQIVRTLVFCFEGDDTAEDTDAHFITQLKGELPFLSIIGLADKSVINYKDIMQLLTNNQLYSYLPLPNKAERINQQILQSVQEAIKIYTGPIFLKWPPIEKIKVEEEKAVTETFSKKITTQFISNIKKIWKKNTD